MSKIHLWILAIFFAFLSGCTPKEDPEPEPQPVDPSIELLSSDQSDLVFPETGGEIKVYFSATGAWTSQVISTVSDNWCTVSPDKGVAGNSLSVTIHTDNNGQEDDRTVTVILLCGSAKVSIKVTQKSKAALTVTKSHFDFEAKGGQLTVEAKANVELVCEVGEDCKDWILPVQTKAMTVSSYQFDVLENEGEKRNGSIVLKSGTLSETVTVTQEAYPPSILLETSSMEIKGESGTVVVPLKTNIPVTVVIPSETGWIHYVMTRAMEEKDVVLSVDQNETGETRSGMISLKNEGYGINETFTLVQESLPVVETEEFYTVGPEGGSIEIKLSTNMDSFSVIVPDEASSWLSLVSTRAMHTEILYFSVAPTTLYETRQASISVNDSSGETIKRFTIKQNAKPIPNNEIWYTTKYGYTIEPETKGFNSRLRENIYSDGHGRLVFDDDVLTVGSKAFAGQTSLIGVTLPNSVTVLGSEAFMGCSSMTDIYLSSGLVKAETDAFADCTGTIHFNGQNLPDKCCTNAGAITGLELGDRVETLGKNAFDGCTALSSVSLPESLKQIGEYCFRNCSSLTEISPANHGIIIGSYAFYGAGIKEFTWYDTMTVGSYAFSHSKLEKVTFVEDPVARTYGLSEGVFESTLLPEITLSANITSIGASAFKNTPLKKIVTGKMLRQIGNKAFSGCIIPEIIIPCYTPPSVGSQTFDRYSSTLFVPEGTELTYALSSYWFPYFKAKYINGFNGFYDFLEAGFDRNYEPYARFYARALVRDTFSYRIVSMGIVADTEENNLTLDKAAYIKEIPFSDELKEEGDSGNDPRYCYRPVFAGLGGKTLKYRAFARFEGTDDVWYSRTSQLSRDRQSFKLPMARLDGAANCHLVKPGGNVTFDAAFGNSNIPVDAVEMKVIWESDGSDQLTSPGSVIARAEYKDWKEEREINTITVYAGSKEGNAVVAALDPYGDILWSWHIWVTSTGLDAMRQIYHNVPSYVMDRNLGALSATPGDPMAVGLVYQWGRKDPYPGLGQYSKGVITDAEVNVRTGTVSYAIHHPETALVKNPDSDDWVYNKANEPERWTSEKGLYDPCPDGWRVPESGPYGIWDRASGTRRSYYLWNSELDGSDLKDVFLTEGTCWYPATEWTHRFVVWGCSTAETGGPVEPYYFEGDTRAYHLDNRVQTPGSRNAVRCISEKEAVGSHEGSEEVDWNL